MVANLRQDIEQEQPLESTLIQIAGHLVALFQDSDVRDLYKALMAESKMHPELCQTYYEAGLLARRLAITRYLQFKSQTESTQFEISWVTAEIFVSLIEAPMLKENLLGLNRPLGKDERRKFIHQRVSIFLKMLKEQ